MPRRPRPELTNPSYRSSHSTSGTGVRALAGFLVALLVLACCAAGVLYWTVHRAQSSSDRAIVFHVAQGDSVSTIAARLNEERLIDNPLLFRLDAKIRDLGGKLKVGDYQLRRNMSIDDTVSALMIYHANTVAVTLPEGFRMEQIAATLDAHHISGDQFLAEARHPGDLHLSVLRAKPAGASLEGYLFPSTYDVPPHFSGKAFARYMVQTLDRKFTASMRARATSEGFSIFQVLTLASIVEREARVESERPKIASVYLNRLKIGMPLQADPTVQYVVGTPSDWWPLLSSAQLRTPARYNTYVNRGLPPGPIANPGLASINAVLYPAHTHFYYFVAKGNGRHAFARTYQQQLANEQKYSTPTS